jgi:hypothetical protein
LLRRGVSTLFLTTHDTLLSFSFSFELCSGRTGVIPSWCRGAQCAPAESIYLTFCFFFLVFWTFFHRCCAHAAQAPPFCYSAERRQRANQRGALSAPHLWTPPGFVAQQTAFAAAAYHSLYHITIRQNDTLPPSQGRPNRQTLRLFDDRGAKASYIPQNGYPAPAKGGAAAQSQ